MDVVVTSGDGTSYAPDIEKIKTIKSFIGDKPLAIASGITPENKSMYEEYVDYFMVASSITDNYENIIETRLKDLIK
jgi:predicted TIM-barrel enzyme